MGFFCLFVLRMGIFVKWVHCECKMLQICSSWIATFFKYIVTLQLQWVQICFDNSEDVLGSPELKNIHNEHQMLLFFRYRR